MKPESNSSPKKKGNDKKNRRIKTGCALIAIALFILVIYLFINGKTTTTGQYPNPNRSLSLVCEKKGERYPKISRTNPSNKEISIVAIFNGDSDLRSISLKYTLVYGSEEEAIEGEALAHFEFGAHLINMKFNEFDNKFSIVDNKLIIYLTGAKTDIEDETRASYFMLDKEVKDGKDLNSLEVMKEAFRNKGFTCEASTDKS